MVFGAIALLGGAWLLMSRKASAASPPSSGPPASSGFLTTGFTVPDAGAIVSAPLPVPGSIAPTGSAVTAAQAVWSNLTPSSGPNSGWVNFSTGSQAAAALLPWATDGSGNYYTQWAGLIYLVNVLPDANGNYSAKPLGT